MNDRMIALLTNDGFVQVIELGDDDDEWKEKIVIDVARDDEDRGKYEVLAVLYDGHWLAVGQRTGFLIVDLKDF